MIEVIDRVPTYPGRVRMTPVAGQANTYDMVRADDPIEPGTPINKALFESIAVEMEAMRQQIDDKMFEMSQRVRLGDLAEGTVFGLYENGVMVPFIKVANQYNGPALVLRKNCVAQGTLTDVGETHYPDSRVDRWLSNVYLYWLDPATQGVISNNGIASRVGDNASVQRKVFLLSVNEYKLTSLDGVPTEGSNQAYFTTNERRVAMLNGTPANHWTRSMNGSKDLAGYVTASGTYGSGSPNSVVAGIRPAFRLPADFEVTVGTPNTANTMATAEVI